MGAVQGLGQLGRGAYAALRVQGVQGVPVLCVAGRDALCEEPYVVGGEGLLAGLRVVVAGEQ